jgi:hypothetical protein
LSLESVEFERKIFFLKQQTFYHPTPPTFSTYFLFSRLKIIHCHARTLLILSAACLVMIASNEHLLWKLGWKKIRTE